MNTTGEQKESTVSGLKHDKEINLSTASSRTSTEWKNRTMTWAEFINRLSAPTITQETADEYKKLSKPERDQMKDVGGYVGGFLKGGRRTKDAVQSRSIVTLDADFLKMDLWPSVELLFEHAAAAYSTHSHTPEAPRMRLIIPLTRVVTPDEYEPIARKIAESFGMNLFDDTTYQASRLMYWPSCPRDGEYLFYYQDEALLDPDKVLAQYEDWKDVTTWPTSERETQIKVNERKKQGEPSEKPGVIGAFCRIYDISTAIETFLSDVYYPTRKPDRYTFTGGSTSGGLVLYDDKFAYSNHATDIIGGKLTNAFDLVRLHKFGDLDEEAKPSTPVNKLPSFKAMSELAMKDKAVSFELKRAALAEINDDFAEENANESSLWIDNLRMAGRGADRRVINNIYNASLILENDPRLKDLIGFNEFTGNLAKLRKPLWEEALDSNWTDGDVSHIRAMMDDLYQVTVSQVNLHDAIVTEAKQHPFHPVKQFIEKEAWDGKNRIGTLLCDYLGVPDDPYTREVTELFFAGAVSRIYKPGCKFDFVLTVIGPQGIGKSTIFRKLAEEFFNDSLTSMDSKDDVQLLSDSWILELAEMAATRRTDIEKQKNFLSRTEDVYRKPYARNNTREKRHVVFVATTNEYTPLKDITGNRRWLMLTCDKAAQKRTVFDGSLEQIVPQLWAEAMNLYKTKYKYGNWLDLSKESQEAALSKQQDAQAEDPMREDIENYLELPIPTNFYELGASEKRNYIQEQLSGENYPYATEYDAFMQREKVTTREVMAELFDYRIGSSDMRQNGNAKKVGMILGALQDWERKTIRMPGEKKPVKGFQRIKKV